MFDDAGHEGTEFVFPVHGVDHDVDVHAVAAVLFEGLRREVRVEAVTHGDRLDDGAQGNGVLGGSQRVGIPEVDLVLSGARLVVRRLRHDAHIGQREADLTTDVLAFVFRSDVEVTGFIEGFLRGSPLVVGLEQIEFTFVAEGAVHSVVRGIPDGSLENGP